jgi:tRNA-splicing ligase RtcB
MSETFLPDNVSMWLSEPLPNDVAASLLTLAQADDVVRVAVMPDVHLARDVCVGAVVATKHLIYPAAVGSDIGCGMAAVAFDATAELLQDERSAATVLAGLYAAVPTNKHPRTTMPHRLPDDLQKTPLSDSALEKRKSRDGRVQLGTLGRGNHFVELQSDNDSRLWLMVHSGSRAMGQTITALHLQTGTGSHSSGLVCFDADTSAGQAYLADVQWAVRYAESNRLAMVHAVAELLAKDFGVETDWTTLIHGNHNHVRRETHEGEDLWVHRKGALPAADDEAGVIPGSMGSASYHVTGRGHAAALCSSSHGAGRALSRTEAARAVKHRDFARQMQGVWYDHRREPALREEAPSAYKDITKVMRAQRELTRITRELRPLLCYKGT